MRRLHCMKYRFIYLLIIPALLLSCSKESEPLPDIGTPETYVGKTLNLNYCGELMPAKLVKMTPGSDGNLILEGNGITDLSQLSIEGLTGYGPAPGILPGSPVITLGISPGIKGSKYVFEGAGNTDFCSSYSFSGFLEGDSLILNITSVELRDLSFANTIWKPVPLKQSGFTIESMPFYLDWELDPAAGIDIDLSGILKAIFLTPIVPTYHNTSYSSLAQLFNSSLQTIAFKENGNIVTRYFSSVEGATQLMTSSGNTIQYVVLNESYLKIYPNPTSLFGLWLVAQSDSEGIPDISFTPSHVKENNNLKELVLPLVKAILPSVLELCQNGVPLEYKKTDNSLDIFLNTQTLLNLMQEGLKVIMQDPAFIDKLMSALEIDENFQDILPELEKLLPQINQVLNATTKLEIGLSLQKYE